MRLLVTGANGQLGWELRRQGAARGWELLGLDIVDLGQGVLDITNRSQVFDRVSRSQADLVINAAAYTAVDKAESEPLMARAVNVDGPDNLGAACAHSGIPLIHVSTDYVFDGQKKGPYLEDDDIAPLGVYGQSKAEGDDKVRERLMQHLIIRTAWVYGVYGHNFVKTILRLARERETLRIIDDQKGCPTFAADLASALLTAAAHLKNPSDHLWGTYHYCGGGETTWYGFTRKIIELAKPLLPLKIKELVPIPTEEYPTPARRPANSVLDCSKFCQIFGVKLIPWPDGLARMMQEWLTSSRAEA